jgi:hypothetical protein
MFDTILNIISVLFVDKQECLKNSTDCQVSNCNWQTLSHTCNIIIDYISPWIQNKPMVAVDVIVKLPYKHHHGDPYIYMWKWFQ